MLKLDTKSALESEDHCHYLHSFIQCESHSSREEGTCLVDVVHNFHEGGPYLWLATLSLLLVPIYWVGGYPAPIPLLRVGKLLLLLNVNEIKIICLLFPF